MKPSLREIVYFSDEMSGCRLIVVWKLVDGIPSQLFGAVRVRCSFMALVRRVSATFLLVVNFFRSRAFSVGRL